MTVPATITTAVTAASDGATAPHDPVFEQLLRSRIVFLGSAVDDDVANRLSMQLLMLAADDDQRDITLYINSPGGSVTAGMAIYDTMNHIKPDVATIGLGFVASMGQFLLSSGARGKRYLLPSTHVLLHQPSAGVQGTASDIGIQATIFTRMKRRLAEITAEQTGQPVDRVTRDADRDMWFTAEEALAYGFVDRIIDGPVG